MTNSASLLKRIGMWVGIWAIIILGILALSVQFKTNMEILTLAFSMSDHMAFPIAAFVEALPVVGPLVSAYYSAMVLHETTAIVSSLLYQPALFGLWVLSRPLERFYRTF